MPRHHLRKAELVLGSLLDDLKVDAPTRPSDKLAVARGIYGCRSEVGSSDASSTIFRPRSKRLVKPLAHHVAERIATDSSRLSSSSPSGEHAGFPMDVFTYHDAVGGGTSSDVRQFLLSLLSAVELPEREATQVLVACHRLLQPSDILLTPETWRPVIVTAMLAAAEILCGVGGFVRMEHAILRTVAHFWPADRAVRGLHVFKCREAFQRDMLTLSSFTETYFLLRGKGLAIGDDEKSLPSANPPTVTESQMSQSGALEYSSETGAEEVVKTVGVSNSQFGCTRVSL